MKRSWNRDSETPNTFYNVTVAETQEYSVISYETSTCFSLQFIIHFTRVSNRQLSYQRSQLLATTRSQLLQSILVISSSHYSLTTNSYNQNHHLLTFNLRTTAKSASVKIMRSSDDIKEKMQKARQAAKDRFKNDPEALRRRQGQLHWTETRRQLIQNFKIQKSSRVFLWMLRMRKIW